MSGTGVQLRVNPKTRTIEQVQTFQGMVEATWSLSRS